MSKRVFRNLRELLDVVKPITTGGVLTAQSDGSFEFTDSSAPDLSSYAPLAGATFTGPLVLSPTGTSRALTINQPLLATQDAIQVNAPGGSGGDLFKLDKDGNAAFAGTVTPGSPVALTKGGTGANLAATGPGFIRQLTMGAALTVAALTAADLGSGSPTGNFLKGDLTWSAVPSTPPGGTGTELQYRNGSAFGAVTGSSVSGGTIIAPFFSGDGSNLTNLPAAQIVGTVPLAHGGTGQTTAAAGFNALSPLTTLGDTLYGGASGAGTRLAGNTTSTQKFLAQTGDGTNSAAPSWATVTVPTAADPSATIGLTSVPGTASTYMRSDGAPALSTNVAWLAGRSGGQTLNGDTASGGNLTIASTAHATKGKILFGTSAYDEMNNRLGVGTQSPTCLVQAISSVTDIRFSTGNLGVTPTVAAINTGLSGKAGAIVAGTTGAGFCYDSGGVFVIIAESHSAFTGNTLGAGTTVAQFNSDGTSTFNFPLTISDTSNLQKGLKILATGAPRIDLYQSGNASSRNWTILPDTAAFGDLSILQSSAAGGNPVTAGVNRLYISPTGKIGFGNVTAPLSALDVNGGIAVGTYAGANAAPANGLIVSGPTYVGRATDDGSGAKFQVNGDASFGGTGIVTGTRFQSPSGINAFDGTGFGLNSGGKVWWSSGGLAPNFGGGDTGLARNSVGVVRVTNGSSGYGSLLAAGGTFNANGSASTPALLASGTWFTGGTGTTTKPQLLIEPAGTTSTAWNVNGTGVGVNAPSGYTGNLFDGQVNGVSKASIDYTGAATFAGPVQVTAYTGVDEDLIKISNGAFFGGGTVAKYTRGTGWQMLSNSGIKIWAGQSFGATPSTTLNANGLILNPGLSASSGTDKALSVTPTYNQTSAAGSADIFSNRIQTAIGSGSHYLLQQQVGGADKFTVDRNGVVNAADIFQSSVGFRTTGVNNYIGVLSSTRGVINQGSFAFFNQSNAEIARFNNTGLLLGNTNGVAGLDVQTPITAASGVAYGQRNQQTLTAAANGDVLNAHLVNATSVPGAFTGVTTYLYRGQNAGADKWWVDKSGNSYFAGLPRIDSPATAPSTQVLSAMPLTVYGGSSAMMGAPDGWLLANVNGMNVKIPYML